MMITKLESLFPSSRVEDAVQCPIRIPVVDGAGGCRRAYARGNDGGGPELPVLEVMRSDVPTVEHRKLEGALRAMQEKRLPAVGVTDGARRLIGRITPETSRGRHAITLAQHRSVGQPFRRSPGGGAAPVRRAVPGEFGMRRTLSGLRRSRRTGRPRGRSGARS
jgi:hypothetical protein